MSLFPPALHEKTRSSCFKKKVGASNSSAPTVDEVRDATGLFRYSLRSDKSYGWVFGTLLECIDYSQAEVWWGRLTVYLQATTYILHLSLLQPGRIKGDRTTSRGGSSPADAKARFISRSDCSTSSSSTNGTVGFFRAKWQMYDSHRIGLRHIYEPCSKLRKQNNCLEKDDGDARGHFPIDIPKVNYQDKPHYKVRLANCMAKGD